MSKSEPSGISAEGRQRNNLQSVCSIFLSSSPIRRNRKKRNERKGGTTKMVAAQQEEGGSRGRDSVLSCTRKSTGIGLDQFRRLGSLESSGALEKKRRNTGRREWEREREKAKEYKRVWGGWASCQPHVVWPLRHMTRCGPSFISQELQTALSPTVFLSCLPIPSFFHPHEGSFFIFFIIIFFLEFASKCRSARFSLGAHGRARGVVMTNARMESYFTSHFPVTVNF